MVAATGMIANVILTQFAARQASARAKSAVEFFMRLGNFAECDEGLASVIVLKTISLRRAGLLSVAALKTQTQTLT
jgi:hypothetical protein